MKEKSEKLKVKEEGGVLVMRLVLALVLVGLLAGMGLALTTDSVLLTVTPVFNLSINISSTTHTFGSAVGVRSSVTICIGQIENDGNVSTGWQKQTPANSGATSGAWTLITNGTPARDEFGLLAISTGVNVNPNFCGGGTAADSCIDGNHLTGGIGVGTAALDLTEGGAASPSHPTGETRKLWASIMMPYDVTTGSEQTITLSVKAIVK